MKKPSKNVLHGFYYDTNLQTHKLVKLPLPEKERAL